MAKAQKPPVETGGENTEQDNTAKTPLVPASIVPAEDPGGKSTDNIKLSFGEVLLVSITDGQETGIPFKVNEKTYKRYYNDPSKFRLKKTFQL